MNLVQILNPSPESAITSALNGGIIPSMIEITVDIYPLSAGKRRDDRLVGLRATVAECEFLSCPSLIRQITSIYSTQDHGYLIRVEKFHYKLNRVNDNCVSIPGFLQLIAKAIMFTTGDTILFELDDYPQDIKCTIGPLFTTITALNKPVTSEPAPPVKEALRTQLCQSSKWYVEVVYDGDVAITARGKRDPKIAKKYEDIGWNVSLGIRYFATILEDTVPTHHSQADFQTQTVTLSAGTSEYVPAHTFIEGAIYKTIVFIEVWDKDTDKIEEVFFVNPDGTITPAPFPWLPTI